MPWDDPGGGGAGTHASLPDVTPDQHHAQAHAVSGADHSGGISAAQHGALGPIVGAHGHDDLDTVTADQHHAQAHAIGGADHSGALAHGALAGVGVDDHHARDHSIIGATHTGFPGGGTTFLRDDGTFAAPGGGGAPTGAQYVVLAADATLTAERILTAGEGLRQVDAGAGSTITLHAEPQMAYPIDSGGRTFTNLGAGPTEIVSLARIVLDLTNSNEVAVACRVAVAGVTGDLKLQYSTDGAAWSDLTTLIDLSTTGIKQSSFQAVPAGAKGLVIIRIVAVNGNGTEDPQAQAITAHFR